MNTAGHNPMDQTRLNGLSPEQLQRVNQCCDEFERLWKATGDVSMREFLLSVEENDRQIVLPELVLIDIEIRSEKKNSLSVEQYLEACPQIDGEWLAKQLSHSKDLKQGTRPSELPAGQRVGDYVILSPLGSGGMGTVYRAEHVLMKRVVALKIIQGEFRNNLLLQRRFEREVQAIARLSHPNIVTAYDAREDFGWLYLVTELIEGTDLGKFVRKKGPLSPLRASHYAWQAAKGLMYAHEQGIVHRDIKPENLLLDKNQNVKVLDLGLARLNAKNQGMNEGSLTESNQILGTVRFMSPEQARSSATADFRSDIYSLGCTLFYLLTGKPPYLGDTTIETMMAHVTDPVPSASSIATKQPIPPELEQLVMRMMAKAPADRPASMQEVVNALASIVKQLQLQTSLADRELTARESLENNRTIPVATLVRIPKRSIQSQKKLWIAAAVVVGFIALAIAVIGSLPIGRRAIVPTLQQGNLPPQFEFDGINDYFEVPDFTESASGHVAIEAWVRTRSNSKPSNIVTWSGSKCLTLFRSSNEEWGVAYFDGQISHLEVSTQRSSPGQTQLVAALCNGQELSLFIDGENIPTRPIDYVLVPSDARLYIGGIPSGIIPESQGTRFFDGAIFAVRITQSNRPVQIAGRIDQLTVRPETIALFDFRETVGGTNLDLTKRWQGRFYGTVASPD